MKDNTANECGLCGVSDLETVHSETHGHICEDCFDGWSNEADTYSYNNYVDVEW